MDNTAVIQEEIDYLKKKLNLTEGDRKAYWESARTTQKKNKELISQLRVTNKKLHRDLAAAKGQAGDEEVVLSAFGASARRDVALIRSGVLSQEQVIGKYDQKICEMIKHYNAICHKSNVKQNKIIQLQTELAQMKNDAAEAEMKLTGESDSAQTLRILENRLDKASIKCVEANHINNTYKKILSTLQNERLEFDNHIENIQYTIRLKRTEYDEIMSMNKDAEKARDNAKYELSYQDSKLQSNKKEREQALQEYKKQAEEKAEHAERVEKRIARSSLHTEEVANTERDKTQVSNEEQEQKIMGYEEAMHKIKEATGVSDIQEVVQRFLLQGDTQKHLEKLKFDNEKHLLRLREEKDKLQAEFENMKYSGEAKLSNGQRMLEEIQAKLEDCEVKCQNSRLSMEKTDRIQLNVKAGIEHLADKLSTLKLPKGEGPARLTSSSEEYIIDLLGQCEQKLMKLIEDLDGKDVTDLYNGMEDEEFRVSIENKLPKYNVRINLPTVVDRSGYDASSDEEESDADDEAPSRIAIKKQAQQIIDQKTKKTRGGLIRSKKKKKF